MAGGGLLWRAYKEKGGTIYSPSPLRAEETAEKIRRERGVTSMNNTGVLGWDSAIEDDGRPYYSKSGMTRREAKEEIIRHPERYLALDIHSRQRQTDHPSYVCPICGSGTGKNGTGITSKDGIHFTCWAGCFTNSDIIDIIGLENNLTDYNEKLERACSEYGIDYNGLRSDYNLPLASARADFSEPIEPARNQPENGQKSTKDTHNTTDTADTTETEQADYIQFFRACAERRGESDYLAKRGISEQVQALYLIGYCPSWVSPTAQKNGANPPATPRVIIPTSRNSYIARDTRPAESLSDTEKKYSKMKEGKVALFNIRKALEQTEKPIFIVEGEIDALSIIELGYQAIGLGSVNNYKKLLDYVKDNRPSKPLIISLDNETDQQKKEAIEKVSKQLLAGLRELNIDSYKAEISGEYKDANERLVADRDGLREALEDAIEQRERDREEEREAYLRTSTAHYLKDFVNGIADSVNTPYISTGFRELDKLLDGGLYEGLYIIGAISSLGKTTFALQIADQIAEGGQDVLIFSLEMARNQLIAKSISRITAELAIDRNQPLNNAKTSRGITVYNFYKSYSDEEKELINDAIEQYGDYAKHIYIIEGLGEVGIHEIREAVEEHIRQTGNKPVVIIDYLQIIEPYIDPDHPNRVLSDKQNMDKAVKELKLISRDNKLPIITISSFNRDNYSSEVSMQAFKESGAIEYSSDVLIGLQLQGIHEDNFDVNKAKKEKPRKIEAVILKQREGETGDTVNFSYYPQFNYFTSWAGVSGAYQQKQEPKLSKRDKERKALYFAIDIAKDANGVSKLVDVADNMDMSTKQVKAKIADLGLKVNVSKDGLITDIKTESESETQGETA